MFSALVCGVLSSLVTLWPPRVVLSVVELGICQHASLGAAQGMEQKPRAQPGFAFANEATALSPHRLTLAGLAPRM